MATPAPTPNWATYCNASTYYSSIKATLVDVTKTGTELQAALHGVIKSHTIIPYSSTSTDCWDALKVLDADPANDENVLLVYSGRSEPWVNQNSDGWNREHLWPKSYGVGYDGADTSDLFALRACDWSVNSARNNLYFGDCSGVTCESPAHNEAASDTSKDGITRREFDAR